MRVIGGLRFGVALGAPRLRGGRSRARARAGGAGGVKAAALPAAAGRHCGRRPWHAAVRVRRSWPHAARSRLATPGGTRLAFASRLAAAARTFPRPFARALLARAVGSSAEAGVHGKSPSARRDGLPDQLFDRGDRLVVERGDDRDRGAGAPGAAGTADAMHVVVGMMRHVEIEDVADGGNIEAAGGDVGGDQQRNLALAELIERRGARRLIHVAMQGADAEAVLLQRFVDDRRLRACGCRR